MLRLFDLECKDCGDVKEILVNDDEEMSCPKCGGSMKRLPPVFRINMGPAGTHGYYDETLESYVHSNRHRRELCRQKGVTPKGDTPKTGDAWV